MTGVLMTSTACAPTGAELYARAKHANLRMKAEVAALQMQIYDGEWDAGEYGDLTHNCGSLGYRFVFDRSTPNTRGWRLPHATADATAQALMAWLHESGWSGIRKRSYGEGISVVSVEAEKPSAHVDDLLLSISHGEAMDSILLSVKGTCEPGDGDDLHEQMYPDGLENYEERPLEHPTAEPKFGSAEPTPTLTPPPTPTPTPEP
jgi:hypothetical protein